MNDPIFDSASLESTVPRWLWWMNAFCFGYVIVVEFTLFYCLSSLIGLFILTVFAGTLLGVIFGALAYFVERKGVMVYPTTLETGGCRALLLGIVFAYLVHLIRG